MSSPFILPRPVFYHESRPSRPSFTLQQIVAVLPSQQRATKIRDRFEFEVWAVREGETCGPCKPDIIQESTCSIQYERADGERDDLCD